MHAQYQPQRLQAARAENTRAENTGRRERAYAPAFDIYENDDHLLLITDLPGVSKDDVQLHVEKDRLTLEARRNKDEATPIVYRRVFALAPVFESDDIRAELAQGVLRVTLPKSKSVRPRAVPVRTPGAG